MTRWRSCCWVRWSWWSASTRWTRIVDHIQYYLVQWISAVGFVLWLGVGLTAWEFARTRWCSWFAMAPGDTWCRDRRAPGSLRSTIRALPGNAGLVNEDLNLPTTENCSGTCRASRSWTATAKNRPVVLRLDSVTAWEVMAADALLLVQHGRTVQVVETPVTRLLFDALLVPGTSADSRNTSPSAIDLSLTWALARRWSPIRANGPSLTWTDAEHAMSTSLLQTSGQPQFARAPRPTDLRHEWGHATAVLVGIIVVGVALHAWRLGHNGPSFDESFTAMAARPPAR